MRARFIAGRAGTGLIALSPTLTLVLTLTLGLGATGCADFPNVTTVVDLRMLGIMADPPEIYVADSDPASLATQTVPFHTQLTALVVDPQGAGRSVSYSVLACPREIDTVTAATGRNGVVCEHNVPGMAPTSLEVIPPDMPLATPDGEVGEHRIVFDFDVPPPLLGAAFALDPYGAQGFQLPIVVQMELAAGSETIVATKRVIFSQPIPDRAPTPNSNPVPTSITVYPVRDADAEPVAPKPLGEDESYGMPPGSQLWFEPIGTVAEPYSTLTLTRDVPPQVITTDVAAETLRFAFFASAGSFSPPETTTAPSLVRDQKRVHVESQYNAPGVAPADPNVTIWIVARDERGGTSFTRRHVVVGPPPP
jgi:hypothetical protein